MSRRSFEHRIASRTDANGRDIKNANYRTIGLQTRIRDKRSEVDLGEGGGRGFHTSNTCAAGLRMASGRGDVG